MRAIDGDALRKHLLDYFTYSMELCAEISDFIDNAPTIEPEPSQVARDIATIIENEQDMRVILKNAQPDLDEWCTDCAEYDKQKNCCPRFNKVIRNALEEAYAHGETEAEARFHAQQRWIPCSERLPAYGEDVLISIGGYCNVGYIVSVNEEEQYNWYFSGWYHLPNDVDAWMPLPEPYAERRTDEVD